MPRENPYAPPSLNGIADPSPDGYIDMDFSYVYNVTLTANQELRDQTVPIMTDSEFFWCALIVTAATGTFSVRFLNQAGYYLSNAFILSSNLSTSATDPWPVLPPEGFMPGSQIGIDILDTSGATNTVQLLFRGFKRYKRSGYFNPSIPQ